MTTSEMRARIEQARGILSMWMSGGDEDVLRDVVEMAVALLDRVSDYESGCKHGWKALPTRYDYVIDECIAFVDLGNEDARQVAYRSASWIEMAIRDMGGDIEIAEAKRDALGRTATEALRELRTCGAHDAAADALDHALSAPPSAAGESAPSVPVTPGASAPTVGSSSVASPSEAAGMDDLRAVAVEAAQRIERIIEDLLDGRTNGAGYASRCPKGFHGGPDVYAQENAANDLVPIARRLAFAAQNHKRGGT